MKVMGLITEYNPFHLGHLHHLEEARRSCGCDFAIALMSGDFVQRGAPAVFQKHTRAKAALACGIDAVLELPLDAACGSAEHFASTAVSLLTRLGVVTDLCFGCETPDEKLLSELAAVLVEEPEPYRELLRFYLSDGLSFPAARSRALTNYLSHLRGGPPCPEETLTAFLSSPNNILALEYTKAILRQNSPLCVHPVARIGNGYHDRTASDRFASAGALREQIREKGCAGLRGLVPDAAYSIYTEAEQISGPLFSDDFSSVLRYKLMLEDEQTIRRFADIPESLSRRIYRRLNEFRSFTQFTALLKTKEITYTAISRALLHILLDVEKQKDREYVRLLGFRKNAAPLLHEIKQRSAVPLLTKLSSPGIPLSIFETERLAGEIKASQIYTGVLSEKYQTPFIHELSREIIIQ